MDKNIQSKDALYKSLATSLLVCIPSFCFSIYLMETRIAWPSPAWVMAGILCMAGVNFGLVVVLEYYRSRIGRLTLPSLLASDGVVVLYVITESINRFYKDMGYNWLMPAVAAYLALSAVAIFRERIMLLKCQLAFNSLMLAVLWGLGATGRLAMPF